MTNIKGEFITYKNQVLNLKKIIVFKDLEEEGSFPRLTESSPVQRDHLPAAFEVTVSGLN